eukprot:10653728-Lingulodinium_polyedra.AAC.1
MGGERMLPLGVPDRVNLICQPPGYLPVNFTDAEIDDLVAEGQLLADAAAGALASGRASGLRR